jgi:hypothetical protein
MKVCLLFKDCESWIIFLFKHSPIWSKLTYRHSALFGSQDSKSTSVVWPLPLSTYCYVVLQNIYAILNHKNPISLKIRFLISCLWQKFTQDSIYNSCTIGLKMMKSPWCNHNHRGFSNGTKRAPPISLNF